jgi:hypothetical protein
MTSYRIIDVATRRPIQRGIPSWDEARKALRASRRAHRGGDYKIVPERTR